MKRAFAILAAICAAFAIHLPATARVTVVETWEYEVAGDGPAAEAGQAGRFVSGVPLGKIPGAVAPGPTYGPFRVIDDSHAALLGITDDRSPAQFAAMLRDYPGIAILEMIECPGTFDDIANLRLGRMIRAAGIATRVPRGGSVRSGAVELFLAGANRSIEDGASFAVHAWEDDSGRQASDYPASAPENRKYIAYYRDMGMSAQQAQAFYAMTNSAPFEKARWLSAGEMRSWVRFGQAAVYSLAARPLAHAPALAPAAFSLREQRQVRAPRLAYLDLGALLH
ncbi:MAG: hypothetical protein BGO57_08710 [Sphingomonadales bacterium 63-6]|nr:MAG: hypothetical protein BGO57_08710 [Sphingomonadales bacterium 63-6]